MTRPVRCYDPARECRGRYNVTTADPAHWQDMLSTPLVPAHKWRWGEGQRLSAAARGRAVNTPRPSRRTDRLARDDCAGARPCHMLALLRRPAGGRCPRTRRRAPRSDPGGAIHCGCERLFGNRARRRASILALNLASGKRSCTFIAL